MLKGKPLCSSREGEGYVAILTGAKAERAALGVHWKLMELHGTSGVDGEPGER